MLSAGKGMEGVSEPRKLTETERREKIFQDVNDAFFDCQSQEETEKCVRNIDPCLNNYKGENIIDFDAEKWRCLYQNYGRRVKRHDSEKPISEQNIIEPQREPEIKVKGPSGFGFMLTPVYRYSIMTYPDFFKASNESDTDHKHPSNDGVLSTPGGRLGGRIALSSVGFAHFDNSLWRFNLVDLSVYGIEQDKVDNINGEILGATWLFPLGLLPSGRSFIELGASLVKFDPLTGWAASWGNPEIGIAAQIWGDPLNGSIPSKNYSLLKLMTQTNLAFSNVANHLFTGSSGDSNYTFGWQFLAALLGEVQYPQGAFDYQAYAAYHPIWGRAELGAKIYADWHVAQMIALFLQGDVRTIQAIGDKANVPTAVLPGQALEAGAQIGLSIASPH